MVTIPVERYTATGSKDVGSGSSTTTTARGRIRRLRWCPVHDREVAYDELIRGYEYAKDRFVLEEDEDFENLPLPSKQTISLAVFVDASEISGLTLEDLCGGRLPDRTRRGTPARIADLDGARPAHRPRGGAQIQATAVAAPFSDDRWFFEPKLDGIRAITRIVDGDVRLFSRTEREITARYPALVQALAKMGDPWAGILDAKHDLTTLLDAIPSDG